MSSVIQGKEIETGVVKKRKGRPRKTEIQSLGSQQNKLENTKILEKQTVHVKSPQLQPEPDVQPVTEKKKRGRKKKEVVVEEIKQKKKRGRKAAVKYFSSSIRKKIPLTTVIHDNNNYILHLDIKDNKGVNGVTDKRSLTDSTVFSNSLGISECDLGEGDNKLIKSVFEKLNNDEVYNVKRGILDMLDNDQNILADYIDNQEERDEFSGEFENNTLRDLYEKRIQFRENQDKQLVNKLEMLHHDETFLEKLLTDVSTPKETLTQEMAHQKDQETNRKRGYFEILYPFLHNKEWLQGTDVHCWWCCHPFESIPLGLPVDFCSKTKKFRVKGVFCSFACMNSYKYDNRIGKSDSLIKYLYKKLTGESSYTKPLARAPPRCCLKMFGGELSIDEFRESTSEDKIYRMVEYPMYVSRDYVEEIDINNLKSANVKIFDETTLNRVVNLDEKRVFDARMRLSQIEKTTVTLGNTIDKFIKMI